MAGNGFGALSMLCIYIYIYLFIYTCTFVKTFDDNELHIVVISSQADTPAVAIAINKLYVCSY